MKSRPMTERTIPILPCRSIDDVLAFYEALGFTVTYRQERPNTYAVVVRGGIELQFFVLKALDPAASYSTCYVLVPTSIRSTRRSPPAPRGAGRVPTRGIPRIGALRDLTVRRAPVHRRRPRRQLHPDRPADRGPAAADGRDRGPPRARARRRGDPRRLQGRRRGRGQGPDSAFADDPPSAGPIAVRALVLRADLAHRLGNRAEARRRLAEASDIQLSDDERAAIDDELRRAVEVAEDLEG